MGAKKYSPKQLKVIAVIKGLVGELVKIEELEKRRSQPIYNLNCAIDSAFADIGLDNHPPS